MATIAAPRTANPTLVVLLAASVFLGYIDRQALAIAGPQLTVELGLTATAFGIAAAAFYWVYAPGQLVSGWLVDRFSVYRLFAAGMVLTALATLLLGAAIGLAMLVGLRLLLGFGQSFSFTGSSKMIAGHCAPEARGSANGSVSCGMAAGQTFAALVGGLIMAAYGWRAMCVLFGLITLAWLLPWSRIDLGSARQTKDCTSQSIPLREILEMKAVWVCCAAHFCNNYGFYFLITWLPLYLVGERGLSIELMATLTGLSFAMQAISALVSGWVSDQFIIRGVAESRVRKSFQVCGNVGKGLAILGIVLADSQAAMTAWLVLAGVSFGVASSQNFAISQLFAGPPAAGRWVGLQNGAGNVAGIIGPVITGLVIDSTGDYLAAFALAGVITFLAAVFWGFVLPEIQPVQWRTATKPTTT